MVEPLDNEVSGLNRELNAGHEAPGKHSKTVESKNDYITICMEAANISKTSDTNLESVVLDANFDSNTQRWVEFVAKNLPTVFVQAICVGFFVFFVHKSFSEYLDSNLLSVTSHRKLLEDEAMISIQICNNMALHPAKLAAFKNQNPDDFILYNPKKRYHIMNTEKLRTMKLDLEEFMVGCKLFPYNESCFNSFKLLLEFKSICYKANLNIAKQDQIVIDLYFDPQLQETEHLSTPGAFVSVFHPDDYIPPFEGKFLAPGQQTSFSVSFVHKKQKKIVLKSGMRESVWFRNFQFHRYAIPS